MIPTHNKKAGSLKLSSISLRRRVQLAVLVLSGFLILSAYELNASRNVFAQQAPPQQVPSFSVNPSADFTRFKHANPVHSQLPCLLCHVRNTNAPQPKRTGHLPCAGCHSAQFADSSHPICTICHTSSGSAAVKGFPPLRSFTVRFNHSTHIRRTNCVTCHKSAERGVAMSIPSRSAAHTTCFQCHTAGSSSRLSSCGTCHVAGRITSVSVSSKAYRVSFSHLKHSSNNCSSCHQPLARAGRGRQMTAPLVSMHFARKGTASCGNCHDNKRAFGGEDFTDCKRCHKGNSFSF